jgi:uncharacterized protein (TIGR02466 family)
MPNDSDHIDTLRARAEALLHRGAFVEAAPLLREILAAAPADALALEGLALLALETGETEEAVSLFERLLAIAPKRADIHYNLGNAHAAAGRLGEATAAFETAVALDERFVIAWFNLGEVLAQADRLADSIAAYERAIELQPALAPAHANLGAVLTEAGRFDEAIAAFEYAIDLEPGFPPTYTNPGNAYKYAGDLDRAVASHERAIALAPNYADAKYNLASALSMQRRYGDAAAALKDVLALRPELSRARFALGAACLGMGEAAEAVAICDAAAPEDCEMLALKPFALAAAGEAAEAEALADLDRLVVAEAIAAPDGYADLAAFNEALVAHVLAHPSLEQSPTSHATVNGRHTGNLLLEPKGPFADFEALLWRQVKAYTKRLADEVPDNPAAKLRRFKEVVAWSIVMEREGHQVPHIHPTGWVSGVYYPQLPAFRPGSEQAAHAGWIEFGAPPPEIPAAGDTPLRLIEPQEGLLVMFPSFLYHRTIPFDADAARVSIAFDFRPESA